MDRQITFSLAPRHDTSDVFRVTLPVLEFLQSFTSYREAPTKYVGVWSPLVWADDAREAPVTPADVERVCALAFDLDHASDAHMTALAESLSANRWLYALHETFTAGRYRLIVPLARDISAAEYPSVLESVRLALGGFEMDEKCRDLARVFFLPAHPAGQTRESEVGGAVPCDPDQLPATRAAPVLEKPKTPTAPVPKIFDARVAGSPASIDLDALRARCSNLPPAMRGPIMQAIGFKLRLKEGERENQLHKVTCGLVTVLPVDVLASDERSWETVRAVMTPVVEGMENVQDNGPDYYLGRVRSSFDRAIEHRRREESQREAALEFFRPQPGAANEWRGRLLTGESKGTPFTKSCTFNLDLILENDEAFKGHVRFNELRRSLEITGGPLASCEGDLGLELSNWLQASEYGIDLSVQACGLALLQSARRHGYNPVRDYLNGLVWDGTPRIQNVLLDYAGAEGSKDYIEDVTRKFFIAAVARALRPGSKVDTVLVLQGLQGEGKTSFVETIAGLDWYTTVNTRVEDKDAVMKATCAWFVELNELASAQKSTIDVLRGFLSQRSDDIRVPYGRVVENFPRQCVFMGTTNASQPLTDPEGNRRFWVVACGKFDILGVEKVRDQLWAEAVACFREYEKEEPRWKSREISETDMEYRWWLTREEQEIANRENFVFSNENPLVDDIKFWLEKPGKKPEVITAREMCAKLDFNTERLLADPSIITKVGKAMEKMGWRKKKTGTDRLGRYWVYVVPLTQSE